MQPQRKNWIPVLIIQTKQSINKYIGIKDFLKLKKKSLKFKILPSSQLKHEANAP